LLWTSAASGRAANIIRLIDQQVTEPRMEQQLRDTLPTMTAMRDEISLAVRRQYEEMPYPRWMKAAPVGRPTAIDWYLRNQFPAAAIDRLGARKSISINGICSSWSTRRPSSTCTSSGRRSGNRKCSISCAARPIARR
jgi:hypothetical protein